MTDEFWKNKDFWAKIENPQIRLMSVKEILEEYDQVLTEEQIKILKEHEARFL